VLIWSMVTSLSFLMLNVAACAVLFHLNVWKRRIQKSLLSNVACVLCPAVFSGLGLRYPSFNPTTHIALVRFGRIVYTNCFGRNDWCKRDELSCFCEWVVLQLSRKIRSLLAHTSVNNSDPVVAIKSIELFYTLLVPLVPCKLFILSSYFRQP